MCLTGILTLDSLNLSPGGVTDGIALEALFTSLHEVFQPGIIGAGAEISNGCVTPEAFQYNAYLFLGGEPTAGDTPDPFDEIPGFFSL